MTNTTVRNEKHDWRSPKSTNGKTRCLKCGEPKVPDNTVCSGKRVRGGLNPFHSRPSVPMRQRVPDFGPYCEGMDGPGAVRKMPVLTEDERKAARVARNKAKHLRASPKPFATVAAVPSARMLRNAKREDRRRFPTAKSDDGASVFMRSPLQDAAWASWDKAKASLSHGGEIARHKRQRERGMLGFVGFPVVSGIELRHTLHDDVLEASHAG